MKNKNKIFKNIIPIILIIIGIILILYPNIKNINSNYENYLIIKNYNSKIAKYSDKEIEQMLNEAKLYNYNLIGKNLKDPFIKGSGSVVLNNYNEILNVENGIIGNIKIDKINVNLPIYHGTDDNVLNIGIGHCSYSSFPIGGIGTTSILIGHSGLIENRLFSDLDKLELNDEIVISALNKKLNYIVSDLKTVEPDELDNIIIDENNDFIYLITCIPYGINSHRLVVKCSRNE